MGNCLSNTTTNRANEEAGKPFLPLGDLESEGPRDLDSDVSAKDWYHGKLTDREAEKVMLDNTKGIDGAFLVYDNPHRSDGYKIIVNKKGVLHKFIVVKRPDDFQFAVFGQVQADKPFPKLKNLIHYYRGVGATPLTLPSGETVILSKEYKWS